MTEARKRTQQRYRQSAKGKQARTKATQAWRKRHGQEQTEDESYS